MRIDDNPPQKKRIDDNLFTIQCGCLCDWNKAMVMGPWFLRNQALLMEKDDGFHNPRAMVLDKVVV